MSSADAHNPYAPSSSLPPTLAVPAGSGRMEYIKSITFVFDNPNWIFNLLWVAGCLLATVIPVIPAVILIGYQFEVIEALLRRPSAPYPDFQFDQIVKYLVRGLYPFLVLLLCSVVFVPIVMLAVGLPLGGMALLSAAVGEDGVPVVAFVMMPLIVSVALATQIILGIVLIPLALRAGLTQDITPAFNLTFVRDFVKKMWKEEVLAGLFLVFAALLAQVVGLLLFCVGIFFTVAVVHLAQAHLGMQLYRLYLVRGGEKIPLKSGESNI